MNKIIKLINNNKKLYHQVKIKIECYQFQINSINGGVHRVMGIMQPAQLMCIAALPIYQQIINFMIFPIEPKATSNST